MKRTVKNIHQATSEPIGDLSTFRALPTRSMLELDPFLLINHHGFQTYPANNQGLPFGPHPHKGFETLTFIFEGSIAHKDSTGGVHVNQKGGVQWMTAGRGIVHAEISDDEFKAKGGDLEIIQVWMNLPKHLKQTAPAYVGYDEDELTHIVDQNKGTHWHIISGNVGSHQGPHESMTGLFMSSLEVEKGGEFRVEVPRERNIMLYQVRGEATVNGTPVRLRQIVEFENDAEEIEILANEDSLFLFCHGTPIEEPVVAHGPFVMNTYEEINQAIAEYQSGAYGTIG